MEEIVCPECGSTKINLNGHIHNGKQNHVCKVCGKEFVLNPQNKIVPEETKDLIRKMLLERMPLRGICRVTGVNLPWLLSFIVKEYNEVPEDLGVKMNLIEEKDSVIIGSLEAEADEMWSFVKRKEDKYWVWIAIDVKTRQVIAFYVGDRTRESAVKLWERMPKKYKQHTIFYTDDWDAYKEVIPKDQHVVCSKGSGKTNIIG